MNRWLVCVALLLGACSARAETICRFVSAPGLAFGVYDATSSVPTDSLTNVRVTCERNGGPQLVTLTMRLGPGSNSSSVQTRRMNQLGGSDYLNYGLYSDVSRSVVWGMSDNVNTVSQTISIAVPNKGSESATFTIYGRIPALQDVRVGTYADSVGITLTP